MMTRDQLKRSSAVALAVSVVFAIAACAVHIRGGEDTTSAISPVSSTDPLAATLERCRTVTPDQARLLAECRRVWAEKRRGFFGRIKLPTVSTGSPTELPLLPKDQSRFPQDQPAAEPKE